MNRFIPNLRILGLCVVLESERGVVLLEVCSPFLVSQQHMDKRINGNGHGTLRKRWSRLVEVFILEKYQTTGTKLRSGGVDLLKGMVVVEAM